MQPIIKIVEKRFTIPLERSHIRLDPGDVIIIYGIRDGKVFLVTKGSPVTTFGWPVIIDRIIDRTININHT